MDHKAALAACLAGMDRADDFGRLAACYIDLAEKDKRWEKTVRLMYEKEKFLMNENFYLIKQWQDEVKDLKAKYDDLRAKAQASLDSRGTEEITQYRSTESHVLYQAKELFTEADAALRECLGVKP